MYEVGRRTGGQCHAPLSQAFNDLTSTFERLVIFSFSPGWPTTNVDLAFHPSLLLIAISPNFPVFQVKWVLLSAAITTFITRAGGTCVTLLFRVGR